MATILLTGANGKISAAVSAMLKGSAHKVIGLVRDPAKGQALGIELRTGDLEQPRTLEGKFAGVDTAFLLAPAGPYAPTQMSNAIWAAKQAGVKHIVRMSAVGAAHNAPTYNSRLHALSDSELAASGVPFTILKPHFFMQNLLMSAQSVVEQGALYYALGDAKLPMIDTADIAAVVARVLSEPTIHVGKSYTLTGAVAVGMAQVAAALGEAIGKAVKYVPVPVAAAIDSLTKMGANDYMQVSLRDYLTAYSQGWQSEVNGEVKRITGKEPGSIAEFARKYATAFGKR